MKSRKIILGLFLLLAFSALSSFSQNKVDPTFNAVPSQIPVAEKGQVIQPDGKIIIWGGLLTGNGVVKGQVARLNSDGTPDNTFNYCGCHLRLVANVSIQADGRILIAGTDTSSRARIVRVFSDGSADDSFNPLLSTLPNYSAYAYVWGFMPDGRMYIEKTQQQSQFFVRSLYRYDPDGSLDGSFTVIPIHNGSGNPTAITDLAVRPDGKFYLSISGSGGAHLFGSVDLYNLNGTLDNTWEHPIIAASLGNNIQITGLDLQADGNLLVGGRFETVNGLNKKDFVRLAPAGNVDTTFTAPSNFFWGGDVKVLSTGKILVSAVTDVDGTYDLRRLNSDGSLDTFRPKGEIVKDILMGGDFAPPVNISNVLNRFVVDSSDRVIFFGESNTAQRQFYRLNADGSQDLIFNPNVGETGKVYAIARQSDGKVIMAGSFVQMNGTVRNRIARVNTDGTLDPTFDPGTGFDVTPSQLLIQPDGKILALGAFNSYNGAAKVFVARLNSDGSLDSSFSPTFSTQPNSIALQADGKIVFGGNFAMVNSTVRTGVARLNSDGTLDAFNPIIGGTMTIYAVLVQSDGKIVIGGIFSGVNGFSRTNLVRLNSDGTLDQPFNAGSAPIARILLQQADGKIVLATDFSVERRNTDGTADASLNVGFGGGSPSTRINALFIQPDGSILIGGNFGNIGGTFRSNFVRVSSNGKFDVSLFPNGANGEVRAFAGQPDGKVLVGGDFSVFNTAIRAGIARISTLAFRSLSFCDFDGDGKADVSIYRPGTNEWFLLQSTNGFFVTTFGTGGDIPVPGDYDGDGKTDVAIFRPSTGTWWYRSSVNSLFYAVQYGISGDIPMPSDIDGDGQTDLVVYRPSIGYWFRYGSAIQSASVQFGTAGDIPVIGDFDGDGKGDPAIFRPSNGYWWYWSSRTGTQTAFQWGKNGDVPVPADYDGDGKTDMAIWRPLNGTWFIASSSSGLLGGSFGLTGDRPVPTDYDGDGRADLAIYRPSNNIWYIDQSSAGFMGLQFGIGADKPVPNVFLNQ